MWRRGCRFVVGSLVMDLGGMCAMEWGRVLVVHVTERDEGMSVW